MADLSGLPLTMTACPSDLFAPDSDEIDYLIRVGARSSTLLFTETHREFRPYVYGASRLSLRPRF